MKSKLFVFIALLFVQLGYAQTDLFHQSAQNEGLGHASATISNFGSMFGNVAGLADAKDIQFGASYHLVQLASWQSTMSAAGYFPTKFGTAGIGFSRIGDDLFNQQAASLGFANRFGIASIGLKATYLSYNIEGYASKSIPIFDLGGIAELTPQLFVGAYIINISQTKLADFTDERFPTLLVAGVSYRPSDKLMINAEVEQDIDYAASFKAGIAYKPINNLTLRTGINTAPNKQFAGVGFIPNHIPISIDYSLSHDLYWGFAHQISIVYKLKGAKK